MMQEIIAESSKSLKSWYRHRILAFMTFFPPLALSFLFIQAFTGAGGVGFSLAVVAEEQGEWTDKLITALESEEGTIPYFDAIITTENRALEMFKLRQTFAIVYIPEGFNANLTAGEPVIIRAKINTIHEDLSKNLRLGLEGRIYLFIKQYQLEAGTRPGVTIDKQLVYEQELPRPDYMVAGVYVFSIMWFALVIGGILGSEEKENKTVTEITMATRGPLYSKLGKIIAVMVLSALLTAFFAVFCYWLYGVFFESLTSVLIFSVLFTCLSFIFATAGVFYGYKVGDIRAVPAPSVIICVTLWLVAGAINPLEFSAGSELFKLAPSSAAIRIITAILFARGKEYFTESVLVIGIWTALALLGLVAITMKELKKE
ncbi:MAG: ABC transporter permease [Candidatus Odinarchaeota archaeon]